MDRLSLLSRRPVRSFAVALGLLLTVVGTAPAVVAAEDATAQRTQTLAPAPEPTQALLLPAVQAAREAPSGAETTTVQSTQTLASAPEPTPTAASPKLMEFLANGRHIEETAP